ncbi:MAG: hypothetical protein HC770_00630 [Pseudanabaena sp. CRU_2_10]|nr:hypothetical protein [Pseudanabaena sp. CRU_2_10]
MSRVEADLRITEDVALEIGFSARKKEQRLRGKADNLTAKMLTKPMTITTMPEAMTILQNASPSDSWLVASLLRLPKIAFPSRIMVTPSMTNPESRLKSGQFRAR